MHRANFVCMPLNRSSCKTPVTLIAKSLLVLILVNGRQTKLVKDGIKRSNFPLSFKSAIADDGGYDLNSPKFAEPIQNVTAAVGRDALLACIVDDLQNYKVAWVHVDSQTILSIHQNVITQNDRIFINYNDHRSWYLTIKNVREIDRGWYMCQINTDPMTAQQGYLQIVIPPSISFKETSNHVVVREGSNITLSCKAKGYPEPFVIWKREDGRHIHYNGDDVNAVDGESLTFVKISRLHMGAYLCIADNGVPPTVTTRVSLQVQFQPTLMIPNLILAAVPGKDVILECHTEAHPDSINYWTTEDNSMIISGQKYETFSTKNGYNQFMKLKIRNVNAQDFRIYKCVAQNSLGTTDGNIKLESNA